MRVTIGSGDEEEIHYIHTAAIKARSVSNGDVSTSKEIHLPIFDCYAIQIFIEWVYTLKPVQEWEFPTRLELYLLGCTFKIPDLINQAVDLAQETLLEDPELGRGIGALTWTIEAGLGDSKVGQVLVKEVALMMWRVGAEHGAGDRDWEKLAKMAPGTITKLMIELDGETVSIVPFNQLGECRITLPLLKGASGTNTWCNRRRSVVESDTEGGSPDSNVQWYFRL